MTSPQKILRSARNSSQRLHANTQNAGCIDKDASVHIHAGAHYIPLANNLSSRQQDRESARPRELRRVLSCAWKKLIKFPCIKPRRDSVLRFNHLQHSLGVSSLGECIPARCICIKLCRQLHFIQFLIKPLMAAITTILEIRADGAAAAPSSLC